MDPEKNTPNPSEPEPETTREKFVPSKEWQKIPDDDIPVPPGGEFELNLETGERWGRWLDTPDSAPESKTDTTPPTTPPTKVPEGTFDDSNLQPEASPETQEFIESTIKDIDARLTSLEDKRNYLLGDLKSTLDKEYENYQLGLIRINDLPKDMQEVIKRIEFLISQSAMEMAELSNKKSELQNKLRSMEDGDVTTSDSETDITDDNLADLIPGPVHQEKPEENKTTELTEEEKANLPYKEGSVIKVYTVNDRWKDAEITKVYRGVGDGLYGIDAELSYADSGEVIGPYQYSLIHSWQKAWKEQEKRQQTAGAETEDTTAQPELTPGLPQLPVETVDGPIESPDQENASTAREETLEAYNDNANDISPDKPTQQALEPEEIPSEIETETETPEDTYAKNTEIPFDTDAPESESELDKLIQEGTDLQNRISSFNRGIDAPERKQPTNFDEDDEADDTSKKNKPEIMTKTEADEQKLDLAKWYLQDMGYVAPNRNWGYKLANTIFKTEKKGLERVKTGLIESKKQAEQDKKETERELNKQLDRIKSAEKEAGKELEEQRKEYLKLYKEFKIATNVFSDLMAAAKSQVNLEKNNLNEVIPNETLMEELKETRENIRRLDDELWAQQKLLKKLGDTYEGSIWDLSNSGKGEATLRKDMMSQAFEEFKVNQVTIDSLAIELKILDLNRSKNKKGNTTTIVVDGREVTYDTKDLLALGWFIMQQENPTAKQLDNFKNKMTSTMNYDEMYKRYEQSRAVFDERKRSIAKSPDQKTADEIKAKQEQRKQALTEHLNRLINKKTQLGNEQTFLKGELGIFNAQLESAKETLAELTDQKQDAETVKANLDKEITDLEQKIIALATAKPKNLDSPDDADNLPPIDNTKEIELKTKALERKYADLDKIKDEIRELNKTIRNNDQVIEGINQNPDYLKYRNRIPKLNEELEQLDNQIKTLKTEL